MPHSTTDWYQQFPSHSMGSVVFGPDGAPFVTGIDIPVQLLIGPGGDLFYLAHGQLIDSDKPGSGELRRVSHSDGTAGAPSGPVAKP